MIRRKSYAKVTLSLYAYKDEGKLKFRNIIVPIDLFDVVYLKKNPKMEISTNRAYLPNDRRNTVYRTIELMKEAYDIDDNFKVHIIKNIPAQSGMGGGSSNAATVINILNDMYQLKMTFSDKVKVARQIDEDTPYCLLGEPALVEGIGDKITPISLNTELYYLLVKPKFGVSTKRFLKDFDNPNSIYSDISFKMKKACESGNYDDIVSLRHNEFEDKVKEFYPGLQDVIDRLDFLGLDGVGMTGSGSCVFGISRDKEKVMELYEKVVFDYPFAKYGVINPNKTC